MSSRPVAGTRSTLAALCACAAVWLAPLAPAASLIHNGDFEAPAPKGPPAGWTMWGASRYKDPANFTRDTANPHGGTACFRIHHPANTAGYIVSSPRHAVQPKRGMMYTVAFWARREPAGPAVFGIDAYESIRPYREAPTPGFVSLDATGEWTRFELVYHEGWDFHAHKTRFMLLTFKATKDRGKKCTLWIDDVTVAEQPSTREGRLLDMATLEHKPLNHRLRPGPTLAFRVDPMKRLGPATRRAGGISFHRVAGWTRAPYDKQGKWNLHPSLERAVRELRLPMTRFYAVGAEAFPLEASIDKAAAVLRRAGIPQDTTVLEFETQGATSKLPPEAWARGVRHSVEKGYKFRLWEVANEPYVPHGVMAYPTPDDYVRQVKAVRAAVRAVQPTARIGIAIHRHSQRWGNYVLKRAAGHYDFVVGHYYAVSQAHRRTLEAAVLTENFRTLTHALRLNALIEAYNPGRGVYQLDTEWGMHSGGPKGERADYVDRNANLMGTLHRAVRLIYYAREGLLRGASSWEMFSRARSQGFCVLSPDHPDRRSMIYWLYYHFNRHVGPHVLATEGTAPYYVPAAGDDPFTKPGELPGPLTPVLATLREDGRAVHLVVANGSWTRTVPCRIQFAGFRPAGADATLLSHDDLDGKPLLQRKEDFVHPFPVAIARDRLTCDIPPHSVVFLTVRGQ